MTTQMTGTPADFTMPKWARSRLLSNGNLPYPWQRLKQEGRLAFYVNTATGLRVAIDGMVFEDGRRWLHDTCSHPNKLPSWSEYSQVKQIFLGDEAKAIQILAPRSEWVNDMPYCLHLYCCLDGDGLPDFRVTIPELQHTTI